MRLEAAILIGVVLVVSACSPRILTPGAATQPASLEDDRFIMADGAPLPLRRWSPKGKPDAVILALHGFNDYSKAFEKPATFWAMHGLLTYAYDQRGFGDGPAPSRWHGATTLTADLARVSKLIRARHPNLPLFLLGESMGGAVIMAATANRDLAEHDGIILSAPAVWARQVMPGWQRAALWLLSHTAPGLRVSGGGLGRKPSDNLNMLRALSRDPKVIKRTRIDAVFGLVNLMDMALAAASGLSGPALILYGKREDIIPDKARLALEKKLPGKSCDIKIKEYQSGYHMLLRDLKAKLVWTDIVDWTANLKEPPLFASNAERVAASDGQPQNELACEPALP
tara:strand:- start:68 stop:1090 length:1023 start_codon:yes stop_codon:yes gene_type:complete